MPSWDVLGRLKTMASERTSLSGFTSSTSEQIWLCLSYGKLVMANLERVWSTVTLAT
jgi:hypothetical protein